MAHSSKCAQQVQLILRRDGDLRFCVLFDLLEVAALLPDQSTHKVVVCQDFKWDLLSARKRQRESEKMAPRRSVVSSPSLRADG